MSQNYSRSTEVLKKAKLSTTKARKSILEFLIDHHGPFSVEELHKEVSDCDYATVYRCMKKFEEHGIVRRCEFGDSISRYEYQNCDHHHHHIMCKKCRKIATVEYCFVKEMEKMLTDRGYKDVSHTLEFFGICKECQE